MKLVSPLRMTCALQNISGFVLYYNNDSSNGGVARCTQEKWHPHNVDALMILEFNYHIARHCVSS
jgi:hypothetical protein